MNADELKKELREQARKWWFETPEIALDFMIDELLVPIAEPREKRIAELTEQNTSLLTSVENLNKSVQELGNKLTEKVTLESLDVVSGYVKQLEKENAELSMKRKAERKIFQGIVEKKTDQLTKAKRIIKNLMLFAAMDFREYEKEYKEAEQFLKDSEVEK